MKGVIIHALLAVLGLVFAYQTYTRTPEETSVAEVVVAECRREDVKKIYLNTATVEVTAEPVREGDDITFWITTRHRPPEEVTALDPNKNPRRFPPELKSGDSDKSEAGEAAADSGSGEPAKKEEKKKEPSEAHKPKRFLANGAFNAYLKRLTPVRAYRSLGKLDAKQDADFGYGKTLGFLELECGNTTLELQSGARAFGASQRYLRDTKSGITYLFDEPTIGDLESAQFKFMQADLHIWKPEDVEEVVISAQGARKKLIHRDRKLQQAQWVDEAAPAKRNELYANWFSRLSRLRARAYLERGAEPGSDLKGAGIITPVLRIDYKAPDAKDGVLELVRVDDNGVAHYYARTETTRAWVALFDSAAKDVEQDVGMVVGVEQAPDKPAETKPAASSHGKSSSHEEFLPAGHPRVPQGH